MKQLFVTLIFCLAISAAAQEFVAAPDLRPLHSDNSYIVCGTGFSPSDCRLASGVMQLALRDLRVEIPGWRWVIVPTNQWTRTAHSFDVKPTVPAFSSFAVSTTYIYSNLVLLDQRTDENLQSYTKLTGLPRLRWVLAHESGHIVCRTTNETRAEAAGKRIQSGNRDVCR